MVARTLISIAKLGFLAQYYILICLLVVKKLVKKVFYSKTDKKHNIFQHPHNQVHPHVFFDTNDFISHEDFALDTYESPTQDGAYVSFWRIRHKETSKRNNQSPILIQHGLLDCAMSWFLHQRKLQNLPYVLASQGYDVWVGNNRGTVFSDRNSHLSGYWDFSIDHFIKYDQPALINKVLEQTQKEKLIYIGHSQGSTQFVLALNQHPLLKDKIEMFFGMGTVISLSDLKSHKLIDSLSRFYCLQILEKLGFQSILNTPKWMRRKLGVLIHHFEFYVHFIIYVITLICGKTQKNNIDAKRLGVIAAHEPGGTSVKSIKHWIQAYRQGKFRKYDYGKNQNLQIYGSQNAPQYTFDHIKFLPFKTHIFRGTKDAVISEKDFNLLVGYFDEKNIETHLVQDFAHVDYAWSVSAKQHIYDKIVEILKRQNDLMENIPQPLEKCSSYGTEDTSFVSSQRFLEMDY